MPKQVAFSADGQWLACGRVDGTISLWWISDLALQRTIRHPQGVTSIAFSREGRWLADRTVKLWRMKATPGPKR